jgi:small conductance mechanosensitive channel
MKKKIKVTEFSYKELAYTYFFEYAPRIIQAIGIVIFFYLLARYIKYKMLNYNGTKDGKSKNNEKDKILVDICAKLLYYLIIIIGSLSGLVLLGFNLSSLLVLFGSIGLAVALSLQNTLSNASSGMMILILDYYNLNDLVTIDKQTGIVNSFNLFTTTLKDSSGLLITIPNLSIVKGTLTNFTKNENITINITVSVSNSKNTINDRILTIIKNELLAQSSYITNNKNVSVRVSSITDKDSKINCSLPIKSINYNSAMSETEKILNNTINKLQLLNNKNIQVI